MKNEHFQSAQYQQISPINRSQFHQLTTLRSLQSLSQQKGHFKSGLQLAKLSPPGTKNKKTLNYGQVDQNIPKYDQNHNEKDFKLKNVHISDNTIIGELDDFLIQRLNIQEKDIMVECKQQQNQIQKYGLINNLIDYKDESWLCSQMDKFGYGITSNIRIRTQLTTKSDIIHQHHNRNKLKYHSSKQLQNKSLSKNEINYNNKNYHTNKRFNYHSNYSNKSRYLNNNKNQNYYQDVMNNDGELVAFNVPQQVQTSISVDYDDRQQERHYYSSKYLIPTTDHIPLTCCSINNIQCRPFLQSELQQKYNSKIHESVFLQRDHKTNHNVPKESQQNQQEKHNLHCNSSFQVIECEEMVSLTYQEFERLSLCQQMVKKLKTYLFPQIIKQVKQIKQNLMSQKQLIKIQLNQFMQQSLINIRQSVQQKIHQYLSEIGYLYGENRQLLQRNSLLQKQLSKSQIKVKNLQVEIFNYINIIQNTQQKHNQNNTKNQQQQLLQTIQSQQTAIHKLEEKIKRYEIIQNENKILIKKNHQLQKQLKTYYKQFQFQQQRFFQQQQKYFNKNNQNIMVDSLPQYQNDEQVNTFLRKTGQFGSSPQLLSKELKKELQLKPKNNLNYQRQRFSTQNNNQIQYKKQRIRPSYSMYLENPKLNILHKNNQANRYFYQNDKLNEDLLTKKRNQSPYFGPINVSKQKITKNNLLNENNQRFRFTDKTTKNIANLTVYIPKTHRLINQKSTFDAVKSQSKSNKSISPNKRSIQNNNKSTYNLNICKLNENYLKQKDLSLRRPQYNHHQLLTKYQNRIKTLPEQLDTQNVVDYKVHKKHNPISNKVTSQKYNFPTINPSYPYDSSSPKNTHYTSPSQNIFITNRNSHLKKY